MNNHLDITLIKSWFHDEKHQPNQQISPTTLPYYGTKFHWSSVFDPVYQTKNWIYCSSTAGLSQFTAVYILTTALIFFSYLNELRQKTTKMKVV